MSLNHFFTQALFIQFIALLIAHLSSSKELYARTYFAFSCFVVFRFCRIQWRGSVCSKPIAFYHVRFYPPVYHTADSRGHADHGWLKTYHSFSFASWHNPERMHFGALRVLNDDYVTGGGGFQTHPHDNMEIVSIPLSGNLEHGDNMGNTTVIRSGDVQIMSAGTGVMHSEKNHSSDDAVRFLQIWMYPNERDLTPAYDQESFSMESERNELLCVVSPDGEQGVKIHQTSWFHLGAWDNAHKGTYQLHGAGQGVYAFVLEGSIEIDGKPLGRRDGLGIWDAESIAITATDDARFLLMEVPMKW